jgi:predicted porin
MFGGVGKFAGWATMLAAMGVVLGGSASAKAADLGGDCCADLEERVAELEATTARKGNRKVSLTVSGWVNEAIFAWDDGTQHGVYQGTNSLEQSRFRFTGEAKIDKDWSAGFVLEIGAQGNPSNQFSQLADVSQSANPASQDNGMIIRKENWFIKSKVLGQIAVGQNGTATYHLLDDADGTNTRLYADAEAPAVYMSGFFIRSGGNFVPSPPGTPSLKWSDLMRGFNNSTPGQEGRRPVVRYDSPAFAGFVLSAAWGQKYEWDVALTYKNTIGDFKVLAKAGYGSSSDPGTNVGGTTPAGVATTFVVNGTPCISGTSNASSLPAFDCTWEGAAATIMHDPTGLYVYGGWGRQTIDTGNSGTLATLFEPDSSTWFIQSGIEHKWLPLGKTTIFGEYRHDDPGSNPGKTVDASINFWQGGVVQNIEAAAMDLYVIYQHTDGSVTGCTVSATCPKTTTAPAGVTNLDAFQEVIVGGLIQF